MIDPSWATCSEPGCSKQVDRDGVCFRHRVASVGITLRGGALVGRDGWNTTQGDFMREHYGVSTEKEMVKARPDLGKAD